MLFQREERFRNGCACLMLTCLPCLHAKCAMPAAMHRTRRLYPLWCVVLFFGTTGPRGCIHYARLRCAMLAATCTWTQQLHDATDSPIKIECRSDVLGLQSHFDPVGLSTLCAVRHLDLLCDRTRHLGESRHDRSDQHGKANGSKPAMQSSNTTARSTSPSTPINTSYAAQTVQCAVVHAVIAPKPQTAAVTACRWYIIGCKRQSRSAN
jgi:hypothetical protein